jgi:hypothetical protein
MNIRPLLCLILIGCASTPKGVKVMKETFNKDRQFYQKSRNDYEFDQKADHFLTIYAHPQVFKNNIMLKDGIFYVPVEKKKRSLESILKGVSK